MSCESHSLVYCYLLTAYENSKIFISRDGISVCLRNKPVDNFNETQNFILKRLIIYTYFPGIPTLSKATSILCT